MIAAVETNLMSVIMQSLDDVALFVCMMTPMVDEKSRFDVVLSEITAGIVPL